MTLYPKLILDALATVRYPGTGKNLVEAEMVADNLRIESMKVSFSLIFEKPTDPFMKSVIKAAEAAIHTYVSNEVEVVIATESKQAARPEPGKLLPQVKNIIGISSGKGGVGKSTTSVNLALALKAQGAKVGILDADIYGPSIPHMLGAKDQRPFSPDNKHINPIEVFGLQSNSIGYLMPEDNATIWRGPMASSALSQLLNETWWNELDYLVIDMPPGTGDIQLTLSQQIPVTGAIVVTTPQDIALIDAIKGISMFKQVSVSVLGVVENMSTHICSNCGHHEDIFGTGGAEKIANKYGTQVLGKLPLHIRLRQDLDAGTPTVAADPNNEISQAYLELAAKVASQLYWQGSVIPSEIMIREVK